MADDNKQPVNPNTNDDLNIDFDIILDQSEELNKPKDDSKQSSQNSHKSDSDLNFDLSSDSQVKKQEIIIEEIAPIQEVKIPVKEIVEPVQIQNTKILETSDNEYNPNLKSVNETIQQLQEVKEQGKQIISSDKLNEIPTTPTIDAKIAQQETQTINTVPTGTINLDDILPASEIKTESPIQDIPQVPFPQAIQQSTNPYDIVPETTTKVNTDGHKKHLIMVIGIVAACLIAGFFILKTMYPMQFGANNGGSGNNIDTTTQETNPFQETTPPPAEEIVFTGDIGTDDNINELTGNILDLSGDIQDHNITPDKTDPFQDLDNLQTSDEQKKQATIDLLKEFTTKGQYYLDLGKQKKISDMMKFGAFLTNKSTIFINQIENGEILDISSLDGYLAQSSGYLQTLQDLENASNTTPQPQENTGFIDNQTGTQDNGST